MTDLTQSPDDKSIDVEDAMVIEETSSTSEKPAKTGFLWFITLINLIILILLCVGAYWYYTQIASTESSKQSEVLSIQQNLDDQGRSLQSSINQLKQNNQSLEGKLANTQQTNQQALDKVQQNLSIAQQNVENNAIASQSITKRLAEMSGRRPSDWLLAEANYLVNMASRKLYLEKDIRTSVTLLREADARLDDLNDPSLFSVRALIAADIQTLSQVNSVSTDSIALTLAGMLPKISELPLNTLQLPESSIDQDLTLSEDVNDWRENLSKTWKSIVNDLISIDYVDKPLEPYLAERQQWLIEQQLKHANQQNKSSTPIAIKPWPWADTFPIAELNFQRLDKNIVVLNGGDPTTLAFSAGAVAPFNQTDTDKPFVVAGHRDSHFSFLQDIILKDVISLTDAHGRSQLYQVERIDIVDASAAQLALPADEANLVLITCYPFEGIGENADERYVITATPL